MSHTTEIQLEIHVQLLSLHIYSVYLVGNLVSAMCLLQVASPNFPIISVVTMILSIHSSTGYVPLYPQNPSQFAAGPVHQPVYSQPSYPPSGSQYLPLQGYYYGQPTPGTQLPPTGTSHHAGIPPHQQTLGPLMQGPNYQGNI